MKYFVHLLIAIVLSMTLSACAFHPQGTMPLAKPLHRVYLESPEPYGQLSRSLKDYLVMSHVTLTDSPSDATAVISISRDQTIQSLIGVSSTQQTRQYKLKVIVIFDVTDNKGRILLPPQTLSEERTITIQSNQILGSSNEANLFYQQIRRGLAYSIMNRLASKQVADALLHEAP